MKTGGIVRGEGSKIKPMITQETLIRKEQAEEFGKDFMDKLNSGKITSEMIQATKVVPIDIDKGKSCEDIYKEKGFS